MNLLVFSTRIKNVFEKKTIFVLLKYCEKKVFYSRESDIRTQRDFRKDSFWKRQFEKWTFLDVKENSNHEMIL